MTELALTLDDAVAAAATGDVWLFRGRTLADRAIQTLTNSPVNHVGMVVALDDLPPLLWHAELGRSLVDVWTGQRQRGVQLHLLADAARAPRTVPRRPPERPGYASGMCRNIRQLHNFEPPATDEEVRAAALQYVRKISGSSKPSAANAEAFQRAVDEVAAASARLLDQLVTNAPPKDRATEAAKARARAAARYAA